MRDSCKRCRRRPLFRAAEPLENGSPGLTDIVRPQECMRRYQCEVSLNIPDHASTASIVQKRGVLSINEGTISQVLGIIYEKFRHARSIAMCTRKRHFENLSISKIINLEITNSITPAQPLSQVILNRPYNHHRSKVIYTKALS